MNCIDACKEKHGQGTPEYSQCVRDCAGAELAPGVGQEDSDSSSGWVLGILGIGALVGLGIWLGTKK